MEKTADATRFVLFVLAAAATAALPLPTLTGAAAHAPNNTAVGDTLVDAAAAAVIYADAGASDANTNAKTALYADTLAEDALGYVPANAQRTGHFTQRSRRYLKCLLNFICPPLTSCEEEGVCYFLYAGPKPIKVLDPTEPARLIFSFFVL